MIEITDEDIEKIEYKLGLSFDDDSKEFIKCLDTKDIQACPGAGKTTSLVAKLGILSKYMPFPDNSGILVLTHTNVAVDEIKEKLGVDAEKLLRYPNHIGTFQSFINKYLAIPMYIKKFDKRPEKIDSEIFFNKYESILKSYHESVYGWLSSGAKVRGSMHPINFFEKLTLNTDEDAFYFNNQGKALLTRRNKQRFFNTIKTIKNRNIREELISDGYLTYPYCYELAINYLDEYPSISDIFQKRFKYIFVDEAQDTDDRQFEILNRLFPESNVQKIGDNNQAIFSFSGQESSGWSIEADFIEIKNTKRLSSLIANQVFKVAVEPQELNGNEDIQIPPTIILFDNPEEVLQKFAELIVDHDLHEESDCVFKAVGGVAKHNDNGDTLPSYYPLYTQRNNCSLDYDNLLDKLENSSMEYIRLRDYRNIVLDVIVKYLKNKNILNALWNNKSYTKNSLQTFLRENHENEYSNFKLKLYEITQKLSVSECVKDEIRLLLESFLSLIGETIDNNILNMIIEKYEIKFETKSNTNVYQYENGGITFDIEISTIHKVKGETHTATLVLETYNRNNDLYHLLKLLEGRKFAGANVSKKKLVYVAMSRPTHFLCLAIHKVQKGKEITQEEINRLASNGFKVIV